MTGRKQTTAPAVARSYEPALNDCARAVEFLLRKPLTSKEGGPPTAPRQRERTKA